MPQLCEDGTVGQVTTRTRHRSCERVFQSGSDRASTIVCPLSARGELGSAIGMWRTLQHKSNRRRACRGTLNCSAPRRRTKAHHQAHLVWQRLQ